MNTISVSRRKFAQLLGAGAAAALVRPPLSFAKLTQPSATSSTAGGVIVRLSANENPYGPSPNALKAMTDSFGLACRYPDEHNNVLIDKLARLNRVNHDEILLGDGSGEILKLCAETFTGPQKGKLVAADPTFEAILKNLRHGRTPLRLLYRAKGNDRSHAAAANVGQRQHHGTGRCKRESGRYGASSKRSAPKQRNENVRDLGAPKDGPQDNSIAGQLHYVRLQETGRSADKNVEGAERPRRPVIPRTAKSYASHHRQKIRNGNLLGNLSRIDDITFVSGGVAAVVSTAESKS